MKESKEYSKKMMKLYREMRRRPGKQELVSYDEPVDALVYAIVSENITDPAAQAVIKRLKDYFVDYNDLRVATTEEIIETLGKDLPQARAITLALTNALRAVFEKYNILSLQSLKKLGKRPAKMLLEKTTAVTPFVIDYCMLTSLAAHAIPLTPAMLEYLKQNQLVDPAAGYEEIEGFLARQISTKNAFEFYSLLRRESEIQKTRKTAKKTRKSRN